MNPSRLLFEKSRDISQFYGEKLIHEVIPFWMNHSPDRTYGGYFTCLDTEGKVFDTDKFVWLQAREIWMFSKLHNAIKNDEEWRQFFASDEEFNKQVEEWKGMASMGAHFLKEKGKDANGHFYFSLERTGKPLIAPYNIFSDCFAAMAFAQYYKASKEEWAKNLAIQTFENIEKRKETPKGKWEKSIPGTRPFQSFSIPMIDINLCLEMKEALPELDVETRIKNNIEIVFNLFLDERGFFRENISQLDEAKDTFEGRLVNPGHSLEALWFILDVSSRYHWQHYIDKALPCILKTVEFGWDKEHGGVFYFMDAEGKPPQQLEWDQKLWWVHQETLIALAFAFELTGDDQYAFWFEKVHEYAWNHFHDKKNGEWFGYLNRFGNVLLELKGGKWKGFFHTPRFLLQISSIFRRISENQDKPKRQKVQEIYASILVSNRNVLIQ